MPSVTLKSPICALSCAWRQRLGFTVAGAGLVGFVGLVVPALARALGGRRAREVMLSSALIGAALVVAADLVARTVRAPAELPLGAVTALIGVPFFLVRLRKVA